MYVLDTVIYYCNYCRLEVNDVTGLTRNEGHYARCQIQVPDTGHGNVNDLRISRCSGSCDGIHVVSTVGYVTSSLVGGSHQSI